MKIPVYHRDARYKDTVFFAFLQQIVYIVSCQRALFFTETVENRILRQLIVCDDVHLVIAVLRKVFDIHHLIFADRPHILLRQLINLAVRFINGKYSEDTKRYQGKK